MDKYTNSGNFTVDDIHYLCEQRDLKYKNLPEEVRLNDYHAIASEVLAKINQMRKEKVA